MTILQRSQRIVWKNSLEVFIVLLSSEINCHLLSNIDDLLYTPEGSGLHLGNIDYVNTLQVGAASNRRNGQRLERALHVREEVGLTDGLFEKR
jgi:hypothetical protein